MARRMSKGNAAAVVCLLIVGGVLAGIKSILDATGYVFPIGVLVTGAAIYFFYKQSQTAQRLEYLRNKYQDEDTVQRIVQGYMWEGQRADQVIDSLGKPEAVDNKLLKTKKKEVWKYGHQGANRYRLRITLDDDVVVGWDKKS